MSESNKGDGPVRFSEDGELHSAEEVRSEIRFGGPIGFVLNSHLLKLGLSLVAVALAYGAFTN